jgi:diguanylate cyclase (GGDEF)-like protein
MNTTPHRNVLSFADAVRARAGWSESFGARARRALMRWAFRDDLTGLLNRRGFRLAAARRIATAGRRGRALLVLFADVDGFKQINDTFGHREGDRALTRVAAAFRKTFRKTDALARFGGDEFVALVTEEPGCSADRLIRRLRANLARVAADDVRYRLTLTVGFVRQGPERRPSLEELVAAADDRLCERKRARTPLPFRAPSHRGGNGPTIGSGEEA